MDMPYSQLVGTEARLARLEQCDCQKSCYSNGSVHADGATWQKDCNRCSCVVSIEQFLVTRIYIDFKELGKT